MTVAELIISIHAPSRERRQSFFIVGFLQIFQSTLPRGSDSKTIPINSPQKKFQSTLPRGSDSNAKF